MDQPILICEPQCVGFQHSTFNAALLQTVLLAFPDQACVFVGQAEHLVWLRRALVYHLGAESKRLTWHELPSPDRRCRVVRWWHDVSAVTRLPRPVACAQAR
jgi:hypothetical protein